jgi:hypothetical protein
MCENEGSSGKEFGSLSQLSYYHLPLPAWALITLVVVYLR